MTGDQPDGTMLIHIDKNLKCENVLGVIVITYSIKSGKKDGKHYPGTTRVGYLPDTP
jgi:hypothetical protein